MRRTNKRNYLSGLLSYRIPAELIMSSSLGIRRSAAIRKDRSTRRCEAENLSYIREESGVKKNGRVPTSIPTLDVRPVSISCLCRKSATRARPLPSSRAPMGILGVRRIRGMTDILQRPLVRTPSVVDLPLSTLPTTAQRTSGVKETLGGGKRSNSVARGISFDSNRTETFKSSADPVVL
jgi:hypothetical protein